ncbi:MAG: sulfurtransferase [Minwuia sp.]|uniref:sulfurtransferase n=1 Tax=Minwuia sp. TaxID=2493630 RepID=UPI003A87308E
MTDRTERWLVGTDRLAEMLADDNVRIFDCSTRLEPDPASTYRVVPCIEEWRSAHIPGAGFIDIQAKLSKPHPKLRFTFPEPDHFQKAMRELGVGNDSRVVLYSRFHPMWATRVWWMLRAFGFDNAAILDGGIDKWEAEGKPVESGETSYPPGDFTAKPRPGLIASREDVLGAVTNGGALVLNALSREQHEGGGVAYGRPGRIAGSKVAPAREMIDPATKAFRSLEELRAMLDDVGATGEGRLITYCGGGIAATTPAFVMALLGRDDVALYDNSLTEWSVDEALPMETGPQS